MDVPNREQVEARLARLISREMQVELNKLLEGFDLWGNRAHQVLTPRYVA